MKCPLSYSETVVIGGIECRQPAMDCHPDCAWLVVDSPNEYTGHGRPVLRCAVAVLAASSDSLVSSANCVEEG